jgi:MFS family permease
MVLAGGSRVMRTRAGAEARTFWQYWTASTISSMGTAGTSVVLPLLAVLLLNASALQVSLLAAATYTAWALLGLPAGAIVERLPLRRTQVCMNFVRAAALASVPVAWWLHVLQMPQLVVVALVIGVAGVIFDIGSATFLPSIIGNEQLKSWNNMTSTAAGATQLGGPSLSGVIISAFGSLTALATDVFCYLCSALLLSRLPEAEALARTEPHPPVRRQIKQGWHAVTRHGHMRPCMYAATAVNFVAGGLMGVTPVFLVRTLHTPLPLIGLVLAAEGVGSLAGAAVTPWLAMRIGSARSVLVACATSAAAMLLAPLSTRGVGVVLFAVGIAGFAAGVVVLSILARTHRQVVAEPHLLAQVMATVRFVSWSALPLGAVCAGVLSSAFDTRTALYALAIVAFAAPLALIASPVRVAHDLA